MKSLSELLSMAKELVVEIQGAVDEAANQSMKANQTPVVSQVPIVNQDDEIVGNVIPNTMPSAPVDWKIGTLVRPKGYDKSYSAPIINFNEKRDLVFTTVLDDNEKKVMWVPPAQLELAD